MTRCLQVRCLLALALAASPLLGNGASFQFVPAQPDPLDAQTDKLDAYMVKQLEAESTRPPNGHSPAYPDLLNLPHDQKSLLLPKALAAFEDRSRLRSAAAAASASGDWKAAQRALETMHRRVETVGKAAPEKLARELRRFLLPESVYPAPCKRLDLAPPDSPRADFYQTLVENFPDDAALHQGLSQALICSKKFEEALGEAAKAADLDPSNSDAFYTAAYAADRLGDHQYATCYKLKALEMRGGGSRTTCVRSAARPKPRAPYRPATMNWIKFEPDPPDPNEEAYLRSRRNAPYPRAWPRPPRRFAPPGPPDPPPNEGPEGPDGIPYREPKLSLTSNGRTKELSSEVEIRVIEEPEKKPSSPASEAMLAAANISRNAPPRYPPSGLAPNAPEDLPKLMHALREGDRNDRTHAVQSLGIMGGAGLEGLAYAMEDGDWVVRLTAAHWLGRLGAQAAPNLAEAMRTDPCRIVRLTALHWVGSLGPAALDVIAGSDGDESKFLQAYGRYWKRKLSHPGAAATPDEAEPENPADYGEDLNVCTNMDQPGRLKPASLLAQRPPPLQTAKGGAEPVPEADPLLPPIPEKKKDPASALPPAPAPAETPKPPRLSPAAPPLPRDIDQLLELDFKRAEDLAHPKEIPLGEHPEVKAPAPVDLPERAEPESSLDGRLGEPEKTLPAPKAPVRSEPKVEAYAALLDGRDGPLTYDAIPSLIEILKKGNARLRSRAADELGKMGKAADKAVAPLMGALKDPSARVRSSAALALGNIGPAADSAVPLLSKAIRDKNPDVSYSAVLALARMKTPSAQKAYKTYVREEVRRSSGAP